MTPDAQRWVWTPNGMEHYRAHPLMQNSGGVFVTAEAYERLADRLKLCTLCWDVEDKR